MSRYINLKLKNANTNAVIYIKLFTNDNEYGDINDVLFKKVKIISETRDKKPQSFMSNSKYKNMSGKDFTINGNDEYEISAWCNENDD